MKKPILFILVVILTLSLAGNVFQYLQSSVAKQKLIGANEALENARVSSLPTEGGQSSGDPFSSAKDLASTGGGIDSGDVNVANSEIPEASPAQGNPFGSPEEMREMMKSPAMQQMIRGQQKGVIEMMYGELFRYFELEGEESETLTELLLNKQMAGMDLGMRLMDPDLSKDERDALVDELEQLKGEADKAVRASFENKEDLAFYETYNESLPERWHLNNLRSNLENNGTPLTDTQEQAMLDMMYSERKDIDFEYDFSNQENMDLKEVTPANVDRYNEQSEELANTIVDRAAEILAEDQLTTFKDSHNQTKIMQEMGIRWMSEMMRSSQAKE